ncbi:MAG: phosphohydrolase [Pseudolabrys sp.]
MSERIGDWCQTWTGRMFWPLDPRPEDFHVLDIAAGMRNARYGAQSIGVETIGEHSVLMWLVARKRGFSARDRRAVLMHDAPEFILNDMISPLKRFLPDYKAIEDRMAHAIADRFYFDYPLLPEVKELDAGILNDEVRQNMAPPPVPWVGLNGKPLGVPVQCWSPDLAMIRFLHACSVERMI